MDLSWSDYRSCQAHVLFGLRQKGANVKDFAMDFLRSAKYSGFNEAELKVIFNSCLDKPLTTAEQRTLKPLGFPDTVEYLMNREEPGDSTDTSHPVPLPSIPEGCVVGVMTQEFSAPSTSSPVSSAPPVSLRGSRLARRGRGILTGAIRLGRSSLVSPAPETTPDPKSRPLSPILGGRVVGMVVQENSAPSKSSPVSSAPQVSLRGKRERRVSWESASEGSSTEPIVPTTPPPAIALTAPRPKKKKRKKGSSALQPAATPQSAEKQQPLPSPVQPQPGSIQPVLSPQPPAALPVSDPVSSPQPSAALPVIDPVSSLQPPAAPPVIDPVSSLQPPAAPPVIVPALSPLPSAASPVMIPVSPPQPSAAPPVIVTVSMSSPPPDAAPPVMVPVSSPQPPAAPPVTVSMSSPLPDAAPPVMFPVSPQPLNPDLVVPALPQAVSSPRNPVRPARPPRTQPSATPRGQRSRPVPSPIPPPVNVAVPPPPLPCLLFLLSHPNPLVVLSCLPLMVFVMFSWVLSSVQSVLSCVSP
ncbi:uncharacterized protein [Paramisgurnus dabryanus]|uniref:uncharacterized protein n=1 Tax=Paramisgurnus dabryanus TaxID=90735 RepID=UPI003CCFB614